MQTRSIPRGFLVLTLIGAAAVLAVSVRTMVQGNDSLPAAGQPVAQNSTCPDDELEENDDPEALSLHELPFYHERLRACPDDLDWYRFSLPSSPDVQIDAFFDHAEGDIQVSIFNDSGEFITGATSSNDNEKLALDNLTGGNYRVLVFLQTPDLGTAPGNTYTLQVTVLGQCPDDEFENNDTEDTPRQVGVPIYLDGLRACPGDDDYFSFGIQSGEVQIDAFFTHAEGNINLRLIDPDGNVTTSFSETDNEKLVFTVPDTGTYILGVSNVNDLGSAEGNSYALQISQPGSLCPDDEFEDNEDAATATDVTLPYYQAGLRACPNDPDYYSFFASDGDELQVDAFFTAAEGEIGMVLFDPNEPVVTNPSTSLDNKKITFTATKTGFYVLLVVVNIDAGTAVGNTYTLQITGPKPTATPTLTPTATGTLAVIATPTLTPTVTGTLAFTATPTSTPTATSTPLTVAPTNTATTAPPTATTPGLLGDVNCNQAVDAIDAALLLQLIAGLLSSLDCEADADVNLDGNSNSIDVALILQFIAGLLADLPP